MGALSALKKAKPLVSKFDEALANIQRPKGTGNEFLTEVMKQAGVKKAEVEDRKLRQAFEKVGKITKAEAQAIAAKNASPKIQEKVFGQLNDKEWFEEVQNKALYEYGVPYNELDHNQQVDIERWIDKDTSQFGDYRLPGGSNYREIVMKLPSMPDAEKERLMQLEAKHRRLSEPAQWVFEEGPEGQEMKALKDKAKQSAFYSSHWGGEEPNPLAHMRVQDRVGPNGEKILHVEEIQSDWHQKARDVRNKEIKRIMKEEGIPKKDAAAKVPENYGYRTAESNARREELLKIAAPYIERNEAIPKEIYNELTSMPDDLAPPDAPFKKNWHELAMKRLINHAAENGYDKIAITPGAEHASRYSLSNKVNQVEVYKLDNGMYNVEVIGKDGKSISIPDSRSVDADRISEIVGKDVAEKAVGQADQAGNSVLSGLDLEIGGEGMKGFYDKMLPDYLNTLGKKYGAQVGVYDMPNPKTGLSITDIQREQGMNEQQWLDLSGDEKMRLIDEMDAKAKAHTTPLHTFDITPQLREEVTTKGLPLYQQIGMPLGAGAAASELEIPEPEYAAGGQVSYQPIPVQSNNAVMSTAGGSTNNLNPNDNLYLQGQEDIAKMDPRGQREYIANMGGKELRERMLGKYATGGAVNFNTTPDMNDGGAIIQGAPYKRGGKVKITDNLDEMFMEVNNKKFQRK